MVRRIPIPRDWRKENLGSKKRSQRKGENEGASVWDSEEPDGLASGGELGGEARNGRGRSAACAWTSAPVEGAYTL